MGFLFGLLMGSTVFSSGNSVMGMQMQQLSQIPLRCFAALDEGDEAYRRCRAPSLMAELNNQSRSSPTDNGVCWYFFTGLSSQLRQETRKVWEDPCNTSKALDWETKALRSLEARAKQKPASAN